MTEGVDENRSVGNPSNMEDTSKAVTASLGTNEVKSIRVSKKSCSPLETLSWSPLQALTELDFDPSSLQMLREQYGSASSSTKAYVARPTQQRQKRDKILATELRTTSGTVTNNSNDMQKIIHMLEEQQRAIQQLTTKVDLLLSDQRKQSPPIPISSISRSINGTKQQPLFMKNLEKVTEKLQKMWVSRAIRAIYQEAQQERLMERVDVWLFMKWMAAATLLAIRIQSRMPAKKGIGVNKSIIGLWRQYRIPTMFFAVVVFFCIQSGLLHFLYRIFRELPTWMKKQQQNNNNDTDATEQDQLTPVAPVVLDNNDTDHEPSVTVPILPLQPRRRGMLYEIYYFVSGFFFSLVPTWQPQNNTDAAIEEVEVENADGGNTEGSMDAHIAAASGNLRDLERIAASQPFSISKKDENGWTPLHEAARSGSVECVQFLVVSKGLDVNPRTADGSTPLYEANLVHAPQHPVVRLLKRLGGLDIGPTSASEEEEESVSASEEEEDVI